MMGKSIIFLMVFIGLHCSAQGQHVSELGRFEVNQVKGCVPLTVSVTIIPPFTCDVANSCDMDFEGNDSFQQLTFTHTYIQPGNYNLKILFQTTGFDSIAIEVTPNIAPDFDVYTCGNNQVSVKINDTNYDEYEVDYNDGSPTVVLNSGGIHQHAYASSTPQEVTVTGMNLDAADNCSPASRNIMPLVALPTPSITLLQVLDDQTIRVEFDGQPNIQYKLGIATNNATTFQQAKTLYNTFVDTVRSLRTDDNYYCFQVAAFDPCSNTPLPSTTVCSANVDLSVRNNAIDVNWATATASITGFRITRTDADGNIAVSNRPSSPFADTDVTCGLEYCYQVTSNYPNGASSVSLVKCGTGFSTDIPTAITNVTAQVGDNSAVLEWNADPAFIPSFFSLEKSMAGDYSFLDTTILSAYPDPEYRTEDASCYRISYKDVCDNQSPPGIEVCPIRLTGNLLSDNSITLTWTPYEGWTQGVAEYTVEKYSEEGVLLQTFAAGTNTSYVDESDDLNFQTFVYVIRATAVDNNLPRSNSNRISILKDPNLFHPTAFTPNGDNLNDNFTVFGQYVVGFELKIFNRWGELLFTTDDILEGWDGTFRNTEMPEGTYTFIAHITDRAGRTFKRSGSVLLLRK
jgi:gliding motility-associated-like protein